MTKQQFNTLASELGCVARISGAKRKIEFQMVIGVANGYETVVKIDSVRFSQLINKFPQLH
jgi:hypothetical protein